MAGAITAPAFLLEDRMGINRGINPWVSSLPRPELVPQFRGTWTALPFEGADIVIYNDSLYIANDITSANEVPGISLKWQPILIDTGVIKSVKDNVDLLSTYKNTIDTIINSQEEVISNIVQNNAAEQVKLTELVNTTKNVVESLQSQQELNNAATATNIGRLSAPTVESIPGVAGVYNITSGENAGQVWVRNPDMGLWRNNKLEAASISEVKSILYPTMASALEDTFIFSKCIIAGQQGNGDVFELLPANNNTEPDNGIVFRRNDNRLLRRTGNMSYTPEDFGAVGDGVVDDTDALLRLLHCNAPIDLGTKTYRVTKLFIRDAISLDITSSGATIIGDDRLAHADNSDDYSSVLNFVYCKNIKATGKLTVRMKSDWIPTLNASPNRVKGVAGIKLAYCENVEINGKWEVNHTTAFGWLLESSKNVKLTNPQVYSTLADGIHISNDSHNIFVENPTTTLTGDDGVSVVCYDRTPGRRTSDVTVLNANVSKSFARGLVAAGAINVVFKGGVVKDTAASGVKAFNDTHINSGAAENITFMDVSIINPGSFGVPTGLGAGVDIGDGTYGPDNTINCAVQNCTVTGNVRNNCFSIYGTSTQLLGVNRGIGGTTPSMISVHDGASNINLSISNCADTGLICNNMPLISGTIICEDNGGSGTKLISVHNGKLEIRATGNAVNGIGVAACSNLLLSGACINNALEVEEAHIVLTTDGGNNDNILISGMQFLKGAGGANVTVYAAPGSTNCNVVNSSLMGGASATEPILNGVGVSQNNF